MQLDKSKPYAQVIGTTDGSRFEQNGVLFDAQGVSLSEQEVSQNTEPHQDLIPDAPKKRGRPAKVFI